MYVDIPFILSSEYLSKASQFSPARVFSVPLFAPFYFPLGLYMSSFNFIWIPKYTNVSPSISTEETEFVKNVLASIDIEEFRDTHIIL